jgi:hypothetical protein
MKANEVKLADLLNGTVQYRVPLFQRRYSWDEAEWDQLWKDISTLYGSDDSETHFIGAVVTAPVADAPERAAKYLLIDGQQRLTTWRRTRATSLCASRLTGTCATTLSSPRSARSSCLPGFPPRVAGPRCCL